nr:hypothetical protein [Prevotella sp.]
PREAATQETMGSWENPTGESTGKFHDQKSGIDEKTGENYNNTESDVCHNLYGGGNMACTVKGNTFVYMSSAPTAPAGFSDTDYYKAAISNVAKPHFSSFGGGFGVLAKVEGNAHSDINLNQGSGMHSIIGGGLNGPIGGYTDVHVGNNPQSLVHFVYGGGYYAPCHSTNVQITRGTIVEDVFGGSLMGSINDGGELTDIATQLTIGLKNEGEGSSVIIKNENDATLREYKYADLKNQITIMGNVYGGNDVSGAVNGIAKLTLNGGTVKGDVYGAGNGDHLGYYEPGIGNYSEGKNNNYYVVDHSEDNGPSGDTYKGRPQTTGGVDLTLAGNTETERVTVLGQVFGGGNSCTIGQWETNLSSKYEGDPHKWRDDPAYFLGGGKLHVTLGSHVTIGRTHAQLADAADGSKYLNNESENVSGLYMGCSGRHLATQNTDKDDHYYHHYYDKVTAKYWPGFAVYSTEGDGKTLLSRAEGLKSFNAYLNNILVWTDDVQLSIADDAEDIWLANFVGGGFRGSMKAMTAEGQFHYTLPRGVTVGHGIVGGAYNTDVVYRIFATSDGHNYVEESGHYKYLTEVGSLTQYDATSNPEGDYHHIEYAADGTTPTGIIRFYYDGGMLKSNA